jgi:hypothetical protein
LDVLATELGYRRDLLGRTESHLPSSTSTNVSVKNKILKKIRTNYLLFFLIQKKGAPSVRSLIKKKWNQNKKKHDLGYVYDRAIGGTMEDLDDRWILSQGTEPPSCVSDDKAPATLGLKNMAGVFILVAAGIVGGVGLIIIEIMYKKQQDRRTRRMEAARKAADRWKSHVEVRPEKNKIK